MPNSSGQVIPLHAQPRVNESRISQVRERLAAIGARETERPCAAALVTITESGRLEIVTIAVEPAHASLMLQGVEQLETHLQSAAQALTGTISRQIRRIR